MCRLIDRSLPTETPQWPRLPDCPVLCSPCVDHTQLTGSRGPAMKRVAALSERPGSASETNIYKQGFSSTWQAWHFKY